MMLRLRTPHLNQTPTLGYEALLLMSLRVHSASPPFPFLSLNDDKQKLAMLNEVKHLVLRTDGFS